MSNLFSSGGAGNVGFSGETQQSLKFNDDESQYLSWTPAAAGNRKTWTWSGWVKRGNLGSAQYLYFCYGGTTNSTYGGIMITSDVLSLNGATDDFADVAGVFRDPSAWYHIVVALDTTQATAGNRLKFYVNGTERSYTSTGIFPSQNDDLAIGQASPHNIGSRTAYNSSYYFDGYLSDINFIDGQALDASSFGETVDGYWKAKDYSGTYGTNGFHLTFQDDVVSEGFNTVTYAGNGSTQSVSGLGFSPDLVWIKTRQAESHGLWDSVRGAPLNLSSNNANVEGSYTGVTSFDGDGFSLGGAYAGYTESGKTYVAWCWDAGSGSAASNTDGSITSSVKANPDYGFSIVSYTGNGSSNQTVGHGLSVAPDLLIMKNRDDAENWQVNHSSITDGIFNLNTTDAKKDHTAFSSGAIDPAGNTSTVFSMYDGSSSTNYPNESSKDYIVYCFNSAAGYSSIGTYSGTDSAGVTVTTGFRPAFVMIKATNIAENWVIIDNTRNPANPANSYLEPNTSDAEASSSAFDIEFTDTGFVLNGTDDAINGYSGGTGEYIYAAFADTREAAFWKDVSGQGNHWTPNNLDYRDSLIDSPSNNWSVINSQVTRGDVTEKTVFSEGNLKVQGQTSGSATQIAQGTMQFPATGKYYFEVLIVSSDSGSAWHVGICSGYSNSSSVSDSDVYYREDGQKRVDLTNSAYGATYTAGDIIGVSVNIDDDEVEFFKNNSSQGVISHTLSSDFIPMLLVPPTADQAIVNFGQDSTFSGETTAGGNTDANGIGDFKYAPPSGYLALCTANLPEPTIVDGSEHFNTVLYTGDNADRNIDVGFKSDFVWIKQRSSPISHHRLFDSVRGDGQTLFSSLTSNEADGVDDGVDFAYADGFNIDAGANVEYYNGSGRTYASWNWKAGGTAVSNTDGSITSQVSANTDAGFSIVSWAGDGTNQGATVGHSLGVTPSMIIVKSTDSNAGWNVWHKDLTNPTTSRLVLNDTSDEFDSVYVWGSTAPDASTFGVGTVGTTTWTNRSGRNYIAYVFANTEGYLKAGSYTGNGSTDGTFVYTGFRPAFVIMKRTNSTSHWMMMDSERGSYNVNETALWSNLSNEEYTGSNVYTDFTSNGFKLRNNNTGTGNNNVSGSTYIYLAFAETPFKYANAR